MKIHPRSILPVLYGIVVVSALVGLVSVAMLRWNAVQRLKEVPEGRLVKVPTMKEEAILVPESETVIAAIEPGPEVEEPLRKVALPVPQPLTDGAEAKEGDLPEITIAELHRSREPRKLLIDYLIEEAKVRESPKGTLDYLEELEGIALEAVREENRVRARMFEMIADRENRAPIAVGREFYRKRTGQSEAVALEERESLPQVEPAFVLAVPAPLTESLALPLAEEFLKRSGYEEVATRADPGDGSGAMVYGRRSFENRIVAICVRERSDLDRAEPEDEQVVPLGRDVAGEILAHDAIAVVVHPNNPVGSLSLDQLAAIYSGSVRDWAELGGSSGPILPSGIGEWEGMAKRFESRIFRSSGGEIDANLVRSFADSEALTEAIRENPLAIGFVGFSEVSSELRVLALRASEKMRSVEPAAIVIRTGEYPLADPIRIDPGESRDPLIRDFIAFAAGDEGQTVLGDAGWLGFGRTRDSDRTAALAHRRAILEDASVPEDYREFIREADRADTPFNLHFEPGSLELTEVSLRHFRRLTRFLQEPANGSARVLLIGFTDDVGSLDGNERYSMMRAVALAEKLQGEGIDRVRVAGFGESLPVGDNRTGSGKAANRRVEVWIER